MNYGGLKATDVANGEGVRVSLFVSGCPHHCKECFNPETWDYSYGELFTDDITDRIINLLKPDYIAGFSLLGGEPLAPRNQEKVLSLLRKVRAAYPNKTIWCYTGYSFEDVLSGKIGDAETSRGILECIDVLVDGRFEIERKNLSLRFRGSENQRLIDVPASMNARRFCEFVLTN